ncbi:hypothetical protein [Halomonas litopenaei]|uniref:hypothetical protein n=1 Tax=Halomonas litopenaei TaxID=2109328 RepID=UPI003FA19039
MPDRFEVRLDGTVIASGFEEVRPEYTSFQVVETDTNGSAGDFLFEDRQRAHALCERLNREWRNGCMRYVALKFPATGPDEDGEPRDVRACNWRVYDLRDGRRSAETYISYDEAYAEASSLNQM